MSTKNTPVSLFESYGVLGSILGQASTLAGWDDGHPACSAAVTWDGTIEVSGLNEEIGTALAARFELSEIRRSIRRAKPFSTGDDTQHLIHNVWWVGSYAGHPVQVLGHWSTPLGDLDLAEGEELA